MANKEGILNEMRYSIIDESGRMYDPNDRFIVFAAVVTSSLRENFNNLLQKRLKKELFIEHLDSQQNTIISLPDFVSGAFRVAFTRGDHGFVEVVEKLVKKKVVTTWRNLYQKTKARA